MKTLKFAAGLLLLTSACQLAEAETNPLYKENANKGENPLYTEQSVSNQGGSGTSEGTAKDVKQKVAAATAAQKANHNTTRSNRLQPKQADSSDNGKGGGSSATASRAQDYNSSRSNTTAAIERPDVDDDGDSIPEIKVEKFQQRQKLGQVKGVKERK